MLVHPVGTVDRQCQLSDYLVIYQNCTVGAGDYDYPVLGSGTILYSHSSVLGDCKLGDDVIMAANAMVIDCEVPPSTVVVGQPPHNRFLSNKRSVKARCFGPPTVVSKEQPR